MMSLRAYARYRKVHPHSVEEALQRGRLPHAQKVNGRWQIDPAKADQEWLANTDSGQRRRPTRGEMSEMAGGDVANASPAGEIDIEALKGAIEDSDLLRLFVSDRLEQIKIPCDRLAAVVAAVPVNLRAIAFGEILEILHNSITCSITREVFGRE